MKFSVLLPTRNRIELLKYAIETVRLQEYTDWEIIVSDNCSEQDVAGYINSLTDSRIKYFRTKDFVPVTENWNNALEKATGDYIIMLGDDDGLMPTYFSFLEQEIRKFNYPDFIYTGAYIYAYPDVIPEYPYGYLKLFNQAKFIKQRKDPYILNKKMATEYAKDSMNLKMSFAYNMQYSLIKKDMVEKTFNKGDFFQSPYPDFYATNVLFLLANRILIVPSPMVIIGITSKSYGYYFFNNKEEEGVRDLLKNFPRKEDIEPLFKIILPGRIFTTFWLLAMELIRINYSDEYELHVDYARYRRSQIRYVGYQYYRNKVVPKDKFLEFKKLLDPDEIIFLYGLSIAFIISPTFPAIFRKYLNKLYSVFISKDIDVGGNILHNRFNNLMEVFEYYSKS